MPAKKDIREYNRKRRFARTPEPEGKKTARKGKTPVFVIQKHAASSLHYDLRLEYDGVLASWAVPKGPSMRTGVRRLAVHVEDHPYDYRNFEGNIPEGNYGAGSVIVWDRGTFRNLREEKVEKGARLSIAESIDDGKVEFWLEGEKLQGGFVLVRTDEEKDQWLLMKMDDEEARVGGDVTVDEPYSVISGKSVEEVAGDGERKAGKRNKSVGAAV